MPPKVSLEYKENTRDKILESAKRLFEQKGYHETSMDDIVKISGLSKGAIYGYFDSKESLFESLQSDQYSAMLEQAEKLLTSEGSAGSKLERVADLYFLSKDESARELSRMSLQYSAASLNMKPVHGKLEHQHARMRALLSGILKEGIRNGEFRKGIDVDSIALVLFATVKGLTILWATANEPIDWKGARDAMVKMTLEGIASKSK
jgi:AcrR family transcriptional regulator